MVPVLLGIHPRESLVLIAFGGRSGRRLGLTVRVDLPPPDDVEPVVDQAVEALLSDHPAGAAVIVIGSTASADAGPRLSTTAHLAVARLVRCGVEVHTAIWAESTVAGARWACFDECACSGTLPDPSTTPFAAAAVAEGKVVHADRAELERLVSPAEPERIRRREVMLVRTVDASGPDGAATGQDAGADDPKAGWKLVAAAIAAAGRGTLALDDVAVVGLALALLDPRVRDAALLRSSGSSAAAAETLWAALARETPDPEAAEPAALLAASALLRGDGVLANVALDRAERAWPGHRLAGLLRQVAGSGMRPEQFRECVRGNTPVGWP